MRYEVNASIRAIYVSSILIHPVTMESIVLRLRDDDLAVRVAMLKNLEHSSIQDLSLPLRHAIIHCLQDRNDVIVKGAERVLVHWASNNSLLSLLSFIDLDKEETTARTLSLPYA